MEVPPRARKIISTGLACMAGIGTGGAIDYGVGTTLHAGPFAHKTSSCPAPSESAIDTVDQLFTRPPLKTSSQYDGEPYKEKSAEIAQRLGLTMPDNDLAGKLDKDVWRQPFERNFSSAGKYLAQFGINLSVAHPGQFDRSIAMAPTKAELANPAADWTLGAITDGLKILPLQYARAAGLKKVVLANITGNFNGKALTDGEDDTIVMDVNGSQDTSTMSHELEHLVDAQECGGSENMDNDPSYISLHGGDIYHKDPRKDKDETTVTGTINEDLHKTLFATDPSTGCEYQATLKKALPKTVAYSDYGLTGPAEDKAELASNIGFPSEYTTILDRRTPIIREKFEIIMARLYEIDPRLVRYFAGVSGRPHAGHYTVWGKCPDTK